MTPVFSVLIPWANRSALETTLISNAPFFLRHQAEVLVVNGGGDRVELRAMLRRAGVPGVRGIDLPGAAFNRQLCLNIGAAESRGEFLFLLDADICLSSDIFAEAIDHLRAGSCFVAVQRILESNPGHPIFADRPDLSFLARVVETKEFVTQDGRRAVLRDYILPGRSNAGDGLVLMRREDMLRVGGLNSALVGYGYEDTDLQIRLQLLLGLERFDLGEVVHLTHDASRVDRRQWRDNYHRCIDNYRRGHYLGTLEQDVVAWVDRQRHETEISSHQYHDFLNGDAPALS